MSLMGDFAAANHEIIHARLARHLRAEVLAGVENHHNFAWRERARRSRRRRAPQGRDAGRRGRARRDPGLDGHARLRRARPRLGREPRVGEPRRGPRDEPHGRAPALHLEAGAAAARPAPACGCSRPASTRTRSSTRTSTRSSPRRPTSSTSSRASARASCAWPTRARSRRTENVTGDAVRVGDTVRRTARPWSASVQAVLLHLQRAGIRGVPEPLGFDELGREAVGYVAGRGVGRPAPSGRLGGGDARGRRRAAARPARRDARLPAACGRSLDAGDARRPSRRGRVPQRLRSLQRRLRERPAGRRDRLGDGGAGRPRVGRRLRRVSLRPARSRRARGAGRRRDPGGSPRAVLRGVRSSRFGQGDPARDRGPACRRAARSDRVGGGERQRRSSPRTSRTATWRNTRPISPTCATRRELSPAASDQRAGVGVAPPTIPAWQPSPTLVSPSGSRHSSCSSTSSSCSR